MASYPWSSYRDYTQQQPAGKVPEVQCQPVWGELGARTEREGRRQYRAYVRGWLIEESDNPLAEAKRGCYLGSDAFGDWIERLLVGEKPISNQVVAHREWRRTVPLAEILPTLAEFWGVELPELHARRRPNEARDAAMYLCREALGRRLREIGEQFGVGDSAVSFAVQRIHRGMASNRKLHSKLARARNDLIVKFKT